eukprot:Polyplicarium_translucidae@DN2442_c0_g1_i1.p2
MNVTTSDCALLVTEPYCTPSSIRQAVVEVAFKDYGFEELVISPAQHVARCAFPPPADAAWERQHPDGPCLIYGDTAECTWGHGAHGEAAGPRQRGDGAAGGNPCCVVVDCGFQASHVTPMVGDAPVATACQRVPIGGSHLNAFLKHLVSARHCDLDKNELLVQHIKEEACFVSEEFDAAMSRASREMGGWHRRHAANATSLYARYLLPDYNVKNKAVLSQFFATHRDPTVFSEGAALGVAEDLPGGGAQVVHLNNERIVVPEVLFRPIDAGKDVAGIPDAVYRSVMATPPELQPFFSARILVVGGSSKFGGFCRRLYNELRILFPAHWPVTLFQLPQPELTAWKGASAWASTDAWSQYSIHRDGM